MIVDLSNNEPARLIRDRIEDVLGLPEPFNINAPLDPMFARPNLAFDNPF